MSRELHMNRLEHAGLVHKHALNLHDARSVKVRRIADSLAGKRIR